MVIFRVAPGVYRVEDGDDDVAVYHYDNDFWKCERDGTEPPMTTLRGLNACYHIAAAKHMENVLV